MSDDYTAMETCGLYVGDLVVVGRGRVIWRVVGFWRTTDRSMLFASLQRTDRLDVRRSADPGQCRLVGPVVNGALDG